MPAFLTDLEINLQAVEIAFSRMTKSGSRHEESRQRFAIGVITNTVRMKVRHFPFSSLLFSFPFSFLQLLALATVLLESLTTRYSNDLRSSNQNLVCVCVCEHAILRPHGDL
jgi:hypothetical protein